MVLYFATVAQLVEYDLAKVGVAGSSPVCRSQKIEGSYELSFFCKFINGRVP